MNPVVRNGYLQIFAYEKIWRKGKKFLVNSIGKTRGFLPHIWVAEHENDDFAVIHTIDEIQYPIIQHPIVISTIEPKNTNIWSPPISSIFLLLNGNEIPCRV